MPSGSWLGSMATAQRMPWLLIAWSCFFALVGMYVIQVIMGWRDIGGLFANGPFIWIHVLLPVSVGPALLGVYAAWQAWREYRGTDRMAAAYSMVVMLLLLAWIVWGFVARIDDLVSSWWMAMGALGGVLVALAAYWVVRLVMASEERTSAR